MSFLRTDNTVFGTIMVSPRGAICLVQGRKTLKWSFPKGHPNKGETPFQCAARETYEETGIQIPWQTFRPFKLHSGYYYILFVDQEYEFQKRDEYEIINAGWFLLEDIMNLRVNIDISAFLKRMNSILEETVTVWRLLKQRCKGFGFSQRSQRCILPCPIVLPKLDEVSVSLQEEEIQPSWDYST